MLFALDYDGTYTEDPDLWLAFIANARARGHQVWVVTMRNESESEEVREQLLDKVDNIVFTDRRAKALYLRARGVEPDVWIDDMPWFVVGDAVPPSPERCDCTDPVGEATDPDGDMVCTVCDRPC
jgi:hypothetical protein